MNIFVKIAAGISSILVATTAAQAGTGSSNVSAHSTSQYILVLNERGSLYLNGDNDTDLDFVVRDSNGRIVHEDADLTDMTYVALPRGIYTVEVSNLGDVYNVMATQVNGGELLVRR